MVARQRDKEIHRYYEWRLIKRERDRARGGEKRGVQRRRVLGLALNLC